MIDFDFSEIVDCDSEDCGCPCFDYCKDKMYGVDHFCCEEVYRRFMEENHR